MVIRVAEGEGPPNLSWQLGSTAAGVNFLAPPVVDLVGAGGHVEIRAPARAPVVVVVEPSATLPSVIVGAGAAAGHVCKAVEASVG